MAEDRRFREIQRYADVYGFFAGFRTSTLPGRHVQEERSRPQEGARQSCRHQPGHRPRAEDRLTRRPVRRTGFEEARQPNPRAAGAVSSLKAIETGSGLGAIATAATAFDKLKTAS